MVNDYSQAEVTDTQDWHNLSIPKQSQRHRALYPLSDLIGWIKTTRPVAYSAGERKKCEVKR